MMPSAFARKSGYETQPHHHPAPPPKWQQQESPNLMAIVADLYNLNENDRIQMIGESVMTAPQSSGKRPPMNGFIVENDAKADRYVEKLRKLFPGIRVIDRHPGPTPNTVLVRVAGPLQ